MGPGGPRPAGGRKTGNGENRKAGNGLARLGQVRKGFGIRAENGQTGRFA